MDLHLPVDANKVSVMLIELIPVNHNIFIKCFEFSQFRHFM